MSTRCSHCAKESGKSSFLPSLRRPQMVSPCANLAEGHEYKYSIQLPLVDYRIDNRIPMVSMQKYCRERASRIWSLDSYPWGDGKWVADRSCNQAWTGP